MLARSSIAHHAVKSLRRGFASGPNSTGARSVIFSGIQPTGVPHLGNYLGALRRWKVLQDDSPTDAKLIFSLVDLHAITIQQDPNQLRQWRAESLAMLLAIGLDPSRSILFYQSDVPAHAELMWILSCQASTGYLSRMTQWKDKTANEKENSKRGKLGLFSYPVLQAADILIHGATHVPVGVDQAQHLEFTREIAIGFNHVFGNGRQILIPPETLISPAARVKSLTEPQLKMSKSHANPKSKILLTDSKEVIEAKIRSAVTDSQSGITYDQEVRPGVSNLIDLLYHVKHEGGSITQDDLVEDFKTSSLKVLKESVAAAINEQIQPIREQFAQNISSPQLLADIAVSGAQQARDNAALTMTRVRKVIGLS